MTTHGDYRTATLADSLATVQARREAREDAPTAPLYDQDDDRFMLPEERWDEERWDDQKYWAPPALPALPTPPARRPRPSRKQIVVGIAANATLLVAVVMAIGPAHLFVQAASDYTIYGDSLAGGWHNWSYQSSVNLANTAPVARGTRSIAWTPNAGWATLYLRAGSAINLGNYAALRFAMQASQANQHIGVALTDWRNRAIARLMPLDTYGGAPPVGAWKVYTLPRSALAPYTSVAYGVMLQNWSNYAAPRMYVDSIQLLSASTATPVSTATATADPTSAPTATPDPTATAAPPPSGSAGLANAPDTTSDIHVGLPAMTAIGSGQNLLNANPPVREVWDWNGGGSVTSYPTIYAGMYFPVDRQPDTRYYPGAQPLSWFLANHPDWIEYRCDSSTIAYEFGQTTDIPLDTSNPAVLSWLENTFYAPAARSGFGHLDFDNFQMSNAGGWSGQRCGHWTGAPGSSAWVAQYNGTSDDPNYRANEITMARNLQTWLHATYPNVAFAANFSYDDRYPGDSDSLMAHVDLLFDEQGFSNGNNGPPYNYTGGAWVAKAQHTWAFISAGHGWQDINEFGSSFSALTSAQKQWAIANYLLLKNNASWIYICGYQEYGSLLMTPEYTAPIGSPTDTYHQSQNVYVRDFTNGLALVNPSATTSYSVTLSGAYQDLYGHSVGTQVTLPPASGLVLLNG
jgi:hypothetical protein